MCRTDVAYGRKKMLRFRQLARDYSKVTGEVLFGLCADGGNVEAWEEFLRRFHPVILTAVARTARRYTPAYTSLCDDLAQDVYLKLADHQGRVLREFHARQRGSEFKFLSVLAANVVHDHFKKKDHRPVHPVPLDKLAVDPPDPGLPVLISKFDEVLRRKARASERHIFWLYYRWGMTAKEIADIAWFGLTTSGVESVLLRLRAILGGEFG
jgi:DNA-directed RNA polymerase specialized sigma24 family protein